MNACFNRKDSLGERSFSKSSINCERGESNIFEEVDRRALEVTLYNYGSFDDLVWDLILQWNYDNTEKIRAIFRWITAENFDVTLFDEVKSGSAEEGIYLFRNNRIDHAELFHRLVQKLEIQCVIIKGLTKGVSYKTGDDKLNPHRWNAVQIGGQWKLFDICWATKCLESESTSDFAELYFVSDPKQLIYTHFPNDTYWQLLDLPVSEEVFRSLPVLRPFFFHSGLSLLEFNGILETYNGSATISIGHKHFLDRKYLDDNFENSLFGFTFNYISSQSVIFDQRDFVLQETMRQEEIFHLRCPCSGTYYFTLYYTQLLSPLHQHSHGLKKWSAKVTDLSKLHEFKAVCLYKIICHSMSKLRAFPLSMAPIGWGSHLLPMKRFRIVPSHVEAILITTKNELDLFYQKMKPEVRLYAVLSADGRHSKDLESCIQVLEKRSHLYDNRQRPLKDQPHVLVALRLPTSGEYCLEVYANDPNVDGNIFMLICRHLIINQKSLQKNEFIDSSNPSQVSETQGIIRANENNHYHHHPNENLKNNHHHHHTKQILQKQRSDLKELTIFSKGTSNVHKNQKLYKDDFVPRRSYSFKCRIEPSVPCHVIESPNYNSDIFIPQRDNSIIENLQSSYESLNMRSDIVYQSRLKLEMIPSSTVESKHRRNFALISVEDISQKYSKKDENKIIETNNLS